MRIFTHTLQNRKPTHHRRSFAAPFAAWVVALGLGLAGCQPKPETVSPEVRAPEPVVSAEPTVGERVDSAVADAERATDEAGAAIAQSADQAGAVIKDAGITTAVKAKLAADSDLSALRINVDTEAGRVALSGDAPTVAARERASDLARSVDGVVDVDNRLTIQPKG